MTGDQTPPGAGCHLVWVYPGRLSDSLDAATWLETTRELRQMGWRVTLLAAGPAGAQSARGVDFSCLSRPDVYFLRHLVFHAKVLLCLAQMRPRPDVVLIHHTSVVWLLPIRLVRRLVGAGGRPKLVVDTRTLYMAAPGRLGWKGVLQNAYKQFTIWVGNRCADGQTAITRHMAQAIHVPEHQLWGVWPSGVNIEAFASAPAGRTWPGDGMPIHLIYVGSLDPERNLNHLGLAVEAANTEGMSFVLTLIGRGLELSEQERLTRSGLGPVRWVPPIPHECIPAALAQAHIGVLPFPDEEKFRVSSPLKLFEYMAAGLPVLATRIACHTDVVGDGGYVFWAEGSDVQGLVAGLRSAWQKRHSLAEMGDKAAAAASQWTWRESARKLSDALKLGLEKAG